MAKIISTALILVGFILSAFAQDLNPEPRTLGTNWNTLVRECRQSSSVATPIYDDGGDVIINNYSDLNMRLYAKCLWKLRGIMSGGIFDMRKVHDFLQYDFGHLTNYTNIVNMFNACVDAVAVMPPRDRAIALYNCVNESPVSSEMKIRVGN